MIAPSDSELPAGAGRAVDASADHTAGVPSGGALLSGNLINGSEVRVWLSRALKNTTARVALCSGFLRSEALKSLLKRAGARES